MLGVMLALACSVAAQTFTFDTPTDDRWNYEFNFTPGFRPVATCFSSLGTGVPDFWNFNDRSGEFVIAWDTSGQIPPGQGAASYAIRSVRIVLTSPSASQWLVDLTPDEWYTYDINNDTFINGDGIPRGEPGDTDGESDDPDPGRAIELFGAGFGPVYDPNSWNEFSPYVGGTENVSSPRDPFPFVYDPNGHTLHVEDNVEGLWNEDFGVTQFTPVPWAVGVPIDYTPGSQTVPFEVVFDVDLSLSNGRVRQYFQQQLDAGRVFVIVTSLADTSEQAPTESVPVFYTKEGVGLEPGAAPPRLEIVLGIAGDVNGDGCVDLGDLAALLSNFGTTSGATPADGDTDGDGDVDLGDLAGLLAAFGTGDCP